MNTLNKDLEDLSNEDIRAINERNAKRITIKRRLEEAQELREARMELDPLEVLEEAAQFREEIEEPLESTQNNQGNTTMRTVLDNSFKSCPDFMDYVTYVGNIVANNIEGEVTQEKVEKAVAGAIAVDQVLVKHLMNNPHKLAQFVTVVSQGPLPTESFKNPRELLK